MSVHHITANETGQAATSLHEAFRNNLMMQWLAVTPENYEKNGKALFETWLNYGARYGMALRTENFESIAIRRKPGDIKFSIWRMLRSGMFSTPKLLGREGMKRLESLGKLCDKAKIDNMATQKFWHCWVLGTRPDKQKQGFGRQLMNYTFKVAEQDGLPCYLETVQASDEAAVHSHVGYKVLSTIELLDSDFKLATMLRENGI